MLKCVHWWNPQVMTCPNCPNSSELPLLSFVSVYYFLGGCLEPQPPTRPDAYTRIDETVDYYFCMSLTEIVMRPLPAFHRFHFSPLFTTETPFPNMSTSQKQSKAATRDPNAPQAQQERLSAVSVRHARAVPGAESRDEFRPACQVHVGHVLGDAGG